jgi:hypothetical protein
VRRALASALVVGPILAAINHGDALVHGEISGGRLFKIALTFLVPYTVSTFSSVQAMKSRLQPSESIHAEEDRHVSRAG